MYRPPHFAVDDLDRQHDLMVRRPLGLLVTRGEAGLAANPIPFVLDRDRGPFGTLRCHVARANPVWRDFDTKGEVLVVFSDVDRYVTPSWYETKRETGKVVPTWNYATVHAHGRMTAIEDPAWLSAQIRALTDRHESDRPEPWAVSDAPEPFISAQMRGIVGLEIPISRLEGKWKVSQNRPEPDRTGVAEGMEAEGEDAAHRMAELVRTFGPTR